MTRLVLTVRKKIQKHKRDGGEFPLAMPSVWTLAGLLPQRKSHRWPPPQIKLLEAWSQYLIHSDCFPFFSLETSILNFFLFSSPYPGSSTLTGDNLISYFTEKIQAIWPKLRQFYCSPSSPHLLYMKQLSFYLLRMPDSSHFFIFTDEVFLKLSCDFFLESHSFITCLWWLLFNLLLPPCSSLPTFQMWVLTYSIPSSLLIFHFHPQNHLSYHPRYWWVSGPQAFDALLTYKSLFPTTC